MGITIDNIKMIELLLRLLCDIPETTSDGAYLFTQTQDNQDSVLLSSRYLLNKSFVRKILILNTNAKSGYPGIDTWKHRLVKLGVSHDCIQGVNIEDTMTLNTLIEAEALIRFAKSRGYRSMHIIATPFHQLRAFMTTVTVALREYPMVKLYSKVGDSLPWREEVVHSQGTVKGTRASLIESELERINKYQQKGDLASVEAVLDYLNNRDK